MAEATALVAEAMTDVAEAMAEERREVPEATAVAAEDSTLQSSALSTITRGKERRSRGKGGGVLGKGGRNPGMKMDFQERGRTIGDRRPYVERRMQGSTYSLTMDDTESLSPISQCLSN